MLEKYYRELGKKVNIRENLSLLRGIAKDFKEREKLLQYAKDGQLLIEFLESEDPKVRKNAALLLGELRMEQALEPLWAAYNKEEKLFVKSSYLAALGKLDVKAYLDIFKTHLVALTANEPKESEKKHIYEEIRELEHIIVGIEGTLRHNFTGFSTEQEILLTTNKEQCAVTQREIAGLPASIKRSTKQHSLGVLVRTADILPFTRLRTYRELLFPLRTDGAILQNPKDAAEQIWKSRLLQILEECHTTKAPFYFRLELKSHMELDKKSSFAKRFSSELEAVSGRKLLNSTKDYEVEIRLVETRDGSFVAFLKLYTIPTKRFSYRKHAISSSIHPASAAMMMHLAKPYLKDGAQILDPFCGVGTMLIERDIQVSAREKYGIDIFGDAIHMARENANLAGERIHFIHRDYFDFRHDYLFDEIITNMPMRGKRTREEMDRFYADFFIKSSEILIPGGILILYSNEEGFVKKQLRLQEDYKLLQQFIIREKDHFSLFIVRFSVSTC